MDQAFRIETLDRSGRWYLTPGARSVYDLQIRNDSANSADCSLLIEDPSSGAMANPHSFTLRGHEVRNVTVTFAADAHPTRSQRVAMTLRDGAGAVLATFEHPLIITGGTDCSVSLAWKDAIIEGGEARGFELTCTVRSQSEGPASFPISFTAHPALAVSVLAPIHLDPGQAGEVVIPVRWNRGVYDGDGNNHPMMLEASVPVSNGRRTSRLRWDMIESKLQELTQPRPPAASKPDPVAPIKADSSFAWNNIVAAVQGSPTTAAPAPTGFEVAGRRAGVSTSAPPPWRQVSLQPKAADSASESIELPLFPGLTAKSASPAPQLGLRPYAATQSAVDSEIKTSEPVATLGAAAAFAAASAAARATTDSDLDAAFTSVLSSAEPTQVASFATTTLPAMQHVRARKGLVPPPRAGLLIGGLAVVAIVLAAVLFKPTATSQTPSTARVAVSTSGEAVNPAAPVTTGIQPAPAHKLAVVHAKPAARKVASSMPLPQPATLPAAKVLPAPVAPAPRKKAPQQASPIVASQKPSAARPFQRALRYQPATGGAIVALGGIEAFYGPLGHAVRVIWSAAEQASASVQLIDDHGTTVNAVTVRGTRQAVTMRLPRRFHGPLTVEVSSVGRLGERVAETTSLAAFGE